MEHRRESQASEGFSPARELCPLPCFEPRDERTLKRGISLSGIIHAILAGTLLVYGAELSERDRDLTPQVANATPIMASFVFEKKQESEIKPHLVPEKLAEAKAPAPEPKKAKKPKLQAPKPAPRKTAAKSATRAKKRAPQPRSKIVSKAASAIAPATETSKATTQQASAVETTTQLPKGPNIAPVEETRSAGIPSSVDRKGLLKAYVKTLSKAVRKRRAYPRAAKLAGLEGRAVVRIVLNDRGGIVAIELASSSGHDILDRAALEAARSVGKLPAAPSGLNWGTRAIKVPFSFKVAS